MKYLDEQIEEQLTGSTAGSATGIYQYKVLRKNDSDNTYTTIFVGSVFHEYGTAFKVDITDIVRNDIWLPSEEALYKYITIPPLNIKLVNTYKVDFYIGETSYSSDGVQVAKIYRYPHLLRSMQNNVYFDYTTLGNVSFPLQGRYTLGGSGYYHLTPRYPYISTNNYKMLLASENSLNITSSTLNITGEILSSKSVSFTPPATLIGYNLNTLYSGATYHTITGSMRRGAQGLVNSYNITLSEGSRAEIRSTALQTNTLYIKLVRAANLSFTVAEEYTGWIAANQSTNVQITITSDFLAANADEQLFILLSPQNDTEVTNVSLIDRISYKFNVSPLNTAVLNKTAECTIQFNSSIFRTIWTIPAFDITIPMTSDKTLVEVAGDYVAEIDYNCYSRYYLQWQDRMGSFQSQPFTEHYTYSEKFDKLNITDYTGRKRVSNINVTPLFKIRTGWLKEDVYPYYESIFTSPVLFLYDTQEDKLYSVLVTDSDYTEKTYDNQKKLFNLTLNLELNKTQNIIY